MLQKEMARRISAAPGTSDYGALSLHVQLQYRVEFLRTVQASVFLPEPDVDSAFVRITPRLPNELPPHDPETFLRLVRQGFSQRRKQLRNLLREEIPDWEEAAAEVGFDPRTRAERLSLEQWIALAERSRSRPRTGAGTGASERFPIVDENDLLLGDAPRGEVHGNNLRHRAVHLFIFNQRGELFLQKRSRRKDRHPLLWDSSAAGHVEAGEEYDEAAGRELMEELGASVSLDCIGKLPASAKTGQEFIMIYQGEHDGPFAFPCEEISAVEFFPIEIVERWVANKPEDFAPGFLECWRLFNAISS